MGIKKWNAWEAKPWRRAKNLRNRSDSKETNETLHYLNNRFTSHSHRHGKFL
jgi:hypothetical protein